MRWKYSLKEAIRKKATENPKRYNQLTLTVCDSCVQSLSNYDEEMVKISPDSWSHVEDSYKHQFKGEVKRKSKSLGISDVTYYKALNILIEDDILQKGDKPGYYIFNEKTIKETIIAYGTFPTLEMKAQSNELNKVIETTINKMLDHGFAKDHIDNILFLDLKLK